MRRRRSAQRRPREPRSGPGDSTTTTIDPGPTAANEAARRPAARRPAPGPTSRNTGTADGRPAEGWPPWLVTIIALGACAFAILAFSWGWTRGQLLLDGPGASLWERLAVDSLLHGHLTYWVPQLWSGTPAWAISAPTVTVLPIAPLAALFGSEAAVKAGTIGAQILGAWGAYVLARSLWKRPLPAVVAGVIYGLHPMLVAFAALAGHYPATVVLAATPWLVWSLRKGLRCEGAQYVGLAGVLAGVAVVAQPEYVYGLVLLCATLLVVELARAYKGVEGAGSRMGVAVRAAAVAGLGIGVCAHWLVPLSKLTHWFVLTPATEVRSALTEGLGGAVGRQPSLFFARTNNFGKVVSVATPHVLDPLLYLSWVCLILTFVTIGFLTRQDEDGTLTAILFASAIGLWMQTGGIPLANSSTAQSFQIVPFIVIGIVAGLLAGSFLRRLRPGSSGVVAAVITAGFLALLPYVAPFLTLQRLVPLLSSVRYPRLYAVAILGLSLGAAYPLVVLEKWLKGRSPSLAGLAVSATALALVGAFLVDVHPFRSFYTRSRPDVDTAYAAAARRIDASGIGSRVFVFFGDARPFSPMLDDGFDLSSGWPHPIASKDVWRLTTEAVLASPVGFRDAALGLSSTSHIAFEEPTKQPDGEDLLPAVDMEPNPRVLPVVRAYDQAVVVGDSAIGPELAVDLSQRNVGTITSSSSAARRVAVPHGTVSANACSDVPASTRGNQALAGDVAMACALHDWVGVTDGAKFVDTAQPGTGAVFVSPSNGLRGIGVALDSGEGLAELNLQELDAKGSPVGTPIAGVRMSGDDVNDLPLYSFDPIADSAGKRYQVTITCSLCPPSSQPKIVTVEPERTSGDVVVNHKLDTTRVAAFSLLYDQLPAVAPSTTTVTGTREGAGQWKVTTSGKSASLVVVADSYFPGWTATVDGRSAPVLEADGAFLGVAVGPGNHTIRLSYHAPGVITGFFISFLALVVAGVLIVAGVRQSRRRRRPAPTSITGRWDVAEALARSAPYLPFLRRTPSDRDGSGNGHREVRA